jgi:hypothetical protein
MKEFRLARTWRNNKTLKENPAPASIWIMGQGDLADVDRLI